MEETRIGCNQQFHEIKQSLLQLTNQIEEVSETLSKKEQTCETYQEIYKTLEKEYKTIDNWKQNHKSKTELQHELNEKKTLLDDIENKIRIEQDKCDTKCEQLNKLLLSFLE